MASIACLCKRPSLWYSPGPRDPEAGYAIKDGFRTLSLTNAIKFNTLINRK